jgi:Excalibur calcium-binding domain
MTRSLCLAVAIVAAIGLAVAQASFGAPASSAPAASSTTNDSPNAAPAQRRFRNCRALNRRYPHGVGRRGARDRTSGTPVRNFRRSNALYRRNRHLDRDGDGIACEKR